MQAAAGLEQYISLDCPDTAYSVKTAFTVDFEAHEAHAASRCPSWSLPEEQSEVGVVGITYQVTDVKGRVVAVSSMKDGCMTVVFSPQGAWVCDERLLKLVGSIELKRENRTFWMDLPRADTGGVQRMMALRREQPVEQVEQIAGNPVIEEKWQEAPSSDRVTTFPTSAPQPLLSQQTNPSLTALPSPHQWKYRKQLTQAIKPRLLTTSEENPIQHDIWCPTLLCCNALPETQCLRQERNITCVSSCLSNSSIVGPGGGFSYHWNRGFLVVLHDTVVLHADGEPATKSLVRAIANARVHRTLPRHCPPHSAFRFSRDLCGKQVGSGGGNGLSPSAETSCDRVVGPSRCLAEDQVQHWTRWMLSLQEDLRQAI